MVIPQYQRKYAWKSDNEPVDFVFDDDCVVNGEERLENME